MTDHATAPIPVPRRAQASGGGGGSVDSVGGKSSVGSAGSHEMALRPQSSIKRKISPNHRDLEPTGPPDRTYKVLLRSQSWIP